MFGGCSVRESRPEVLAGVEVSMRTLLIILGSVQAIILVTLAWNMWQLRKLLRQEGHNKGSEGN